MSLKALFAFFLISLIGVAAIASVPLAGPTGDDSDRLGVSPESSSPRNWEIPPFAACFHPEFPPSPEIMAMVHEAMSGARPAFNAVDRWSGFVGEPISLTWSFVPDGVSIPSNGGFDNGGNAAGSNLFSRMDTLFGAANRAVWIAQFEACFARWSFLSGVSFTRVQNGSNPWDDGAMWGSGNSATRGHIRIAMRNIDGGNGILAYNAYPDNGDMLIDSSEGWASTSGTYRFLRNTVMHETGHALGFDHVCPGNGTKLMEPLLNTGFDGLREDEVRGAHFFYGDPNEPNNTSTTTTMMGELTPGVAVNLGTITGASIPGAANLSIDDDGDQDWYRFSVAQPRLVNITVTPVGTTYQDVDQNPNGSCQTSGNNLNALTTANLRFEVSSSSGSTVWRTIDATAAGFAETVTGVLVGPAGNFNVRVSENGIPTETQLYRMTVTAQSVNLLVGATDGTFPGGVRVSWTVIPDATGYEVRRNTANTILGATLVYSGTTALFDDLTATPGVTYYYFVRAQQLGSTVYRDLSPTGESGFAPGLPNNPPVANAGADQSVTDADNNLSESVTLNGSLSSDSDGTITNYRWTEGPTQLATGGSNTAVVSLGVGVHTITLTVTDDDTATATDTVVVTVNAGEPPACASDWDADGDSDSDDIVLFFNDWDNGEGDVDGDGDSDSDDIVTFFGAFEAGC